MAHIIWQELMSGCPSPEHAVRIIIRLLIAMILGAMIGYEREKSGKAAGLRTHIIVALGSAIFVLAPLEAGASVTDVTRAIQGITTGIGFVGAGTIVRPNDADDASGVRGLTTAAGIWLTAAIGVAAGLGRIGVAFFSIVLTIVVLTAFAHLSKMIGKERHKKNHTDDHSESENPTQS